MLVEAVDEQRPVTVEMFDARLVERLQRHVDRARAGVPRRRPSSAARRRAAPVGGGAAGRAATSTRLLIVEGSPAVWRPQSCASIRVRGRRVRARGAAAGCRSGGRADRPTSPAARRWSPIVQRSGRRSGSSSSSQPIGTDTGAPATGPGAERGDERLVDRVLGVVEPGAARRASTPPTPSSRARGRCRRRRATAPRPRRGCRRTCSRSATGTQIWMPRLPVTFGTACTPRCSRAVRCRRASTSTSSNDAVGAGVDVDHRPRRSVRRRATVDVHGCSSMAP